MAKYHELIEKERAERRKDIADIHERIDEVLRAVQKIASGSNNAWARQSIGLTIASVSIIGVIAGIISGMLAPINLNLKYVSDNLDKAEVRCEKRIDMLDDKIMLENIRNKARLEKLEDWQKWWHRALLIKDLRDHGRVIE